MHKYIEKEYELGVDHLREELDEVDAQVDELQAMHSASMIADEKNTTSLYEEDMLALKEDIGELRDMLEEVSVSYNADGAGERTVFDRAKMELQAIRRAFHDLRRQFFYQF